MKIECKEVVLTDERGWRRVAGLLLDGWVVAVQCPVNNGVRVLLTRRKTLFRRLVDRWVGEAPPRTAQAIRTH